MCWLGFLGILTGVSVSWVALAFVVRVFVSFCGFRALGVLSWSTAWVALFP